MVQSRQPWQDGFKQVLAPSKASRVFHISPCFRFFPDILQAGHRFREPSDIAEVLLHIGLVGRLPCGGLPTGLSNLGFVRRLPCSWFAAPGSKKALQLRIGLGRGHGLVDELVG